MAIKHLLATVSALTMASPALSQTSGGGTGALSTPGGAQPEVPSGSAVAAPEAAAATPSDAGVGEIIVTAQHRAERLQSVPIAVTAIDSKTLEQAGIRDITRLEIVTPGLSVGQSGSDSRPALRGVNTDNSRQAQADPSVAFFIDGIYQSSNQQALVGFIDLARVEVQRGPQGTLYGRNSFGGNISLITNLPSDDFEGALRGEFGRFDHRRLDVIANLPLGDTFGVRLAGYYDKSKGYVKNLDPNGSRAGDIDDVYLRGTARWKPSSATQIILRGNVWHGNGHGAGAYEYKVEGILSSPDVASADSSTTVLYINPRAKTSDYLTALANGLVPPGSNLPELAAFPDGVPVPRNPWTINQDTPSTRRIRNNAGSIEVDQDVQFADLKLLASANDFDAVRTGDGDFTQYLLRTNVQQSKNKTQTLEAQLASKTVTPFQWVGGLYYLHTNASEYFNQFRNYRGVFTDDIKTNFGTISVAGYAQASYNLTDAFRATAGVRYTDDKKSASGEDFANAIIIPRDSKHFRRATWRGALDYKVDADKMLYASISTGFRSGGFNPGISVPALGTFDPETVTAYEVGAKTRWLDNKLQLNLSAFFNDFKKLQVVGFDINTNLVFTQNVGHKTAKGIEAELLYRPIRPFELAMSVGYLDAKWKNGFAIDPVSFAGNVDLTGNRAAFSPRLRIGASASYDIPLGDLGTLTPRVQTRYSSRYYLLDYNTIIERQTAYTKTDLRLTYAPAGQRFTVEGFVTNIENKAVKSGGEFGGRGAFFIAYEPPRQWGLALGAKF